MLNLIRHFVFASLLISAAAKADSANVKFDVVLSPAGSFKADLDKVTGYAYKTADGGYEATEVTVDLNSISTGVGLRDKHTKEHLMVEKYPTAKLVSASGKNGTGKAIIDIKGKKQPVEGTYKVEGNMFSAEFPMLLTDLDIKSVRYMGVGVKDKILVHVNLPIKDKAPAKVAEAAPVAAETPAAAAPTKKKTAVKTKKKK